MCRAMQYQVSEMIQGQYIVEDVEGGVPVSEIVDLAEGLRRAHLLNTGAMTRADALDIANAVLNKETVVVGELVQCIACECWVEEMVMQDTLCADLYICVECYQGACQDMAVF